MKTKYKILSFVGVFTAVFIGSVLVTQASTCLGSFFGGTGFCYSTGSTGGIQSGAIPFGTGVTGLATSSNLTFTSGTLNFSTIYASTTGLSGTFLCLTGDTCRTTWPLSGTATSTFAATWPITLTTSPSNITYGFNGLSTSTAAVVGNIPYFSGVNTFANVATGTESISSPLTGSNFTIVGSGGSIGCQTASGSQAGCLGSVDWTTFNNKIGWGQATSTSANQFVYTNNNGLLVSVASSSLSLPNAALQNSTISGVSLGSNLANLTATDGTLTFSGSYNGGTARTVGINLGNANTWTATQTFNNATYSALFTGGNVGIGTTTPRASLSVVSSTLLGSANLVGEFVGTASNNSQVNFNNTQGKNMNITFQNNFANDWYVGNQATDGTNRFRLFNSDANGNSEVFTILQSGNVGIGTASPQGLLDIKTGSATVPQMLLEPSTAIGAFFSYSGALWNDSTENMLAYFNGNTLYIGGHLYSSEANQTINSSTPTSVFSSTNMGTTTIAANSLKVGQHFNLWGAGYYSTPIGNTDTVTITSSIASSTVTTISTVTTAAFPATATNLPFDYNLKCTVRSIGIAAMIVCDGGFNYATALSGVAKTSNNLSTVGTITFDSTTKEILNIKANWSAAAGGQTATVQEAWIDF